MRDWPQDTIRPGHVPDFSKLVAGRPEHFSLIVLLVTIAAKNGRQSHDRFPPMPSLVNRGTRPDGQHDNPGTQYEYISKAIIYVQDDLRVLDTHPNDTTVVTRLSVGDLSQDVFPGIMIFLHMQCPA